MDGLIATSGDAGYMTDFDEDAVGRFVDAINTGNFLDCDNNTVSYDAVDGLIAIGFDARNLMDWYEYAAGGYIDAIDAGVSMNCADIPD